MQKQSSRPAEEEVVLVTGALSGLGKELARALAGSGATVLLHGRDATRGETTVAELSESTGSERIAFYRADFASLAEVGRLADRLLAECQRLTVVVNNAGVGRGPPGRPRALSADGHELRFAVNYLAPVLLTRWLVPLLAVSAPARIVNVASAGQVAIDFDDPMLDYGYEGVRAYRQSKLALVMFTFDLAAELRDSGVTVNCLHPATRMPTKMTREAEVEPATSLEQGLEPTLRLVTGADVDGVTGRYYDGLREGVTHPQAYDLEARRRLRRLTEHLLELRERRTSAPARASRAE